MFVVMQKKAITVVMFRCSQQIHEDFSSGFIVFVVHITKFCFLEDNAELIKSFREMCFINPTMH